MEDDIINNSDREFSKELGFTPSWETCYRPDLYLKKVKECNMCEFREHSYCRESPRYKLFKKEEKRNKDNG